jgi:hypothetical protein
VTEADPADRIRDRVIVRAEFHWDHAAALAAAGLE